MSKFFLSLEDKLLRLFGGTSIQNFMKNELFDDAPLESELLTKSLDAAQKRLEETEYESRKNLFDYDEILNKQRNIIYYERRKILESSSLKIELLAYGEQIIIEIIKKIKKKNLQSINIASRLEHFFANHLALTGFLKKADTLEFDQIEMKTYLFQQFWLCYESKVLDLEIRHVGIIRALERTLILVYLDIEWKEHLQKMSLLRDAVGWRSYGQRNPLFEYTDEAYELFKSRGLITRHLVMYDLIRSCII